MGILAGIEETIKLLSDIDKISIRCMPEGMVFKDFQQASDIRKNAIGQFQFLEL